MSAAGTTRAEGWYPVMIGGRLVCLHWTGAVWQIPRRVYPRRTLPASAVAAATQVEWPEENEQDL